MKQMPTEGQLFRDVDKTWRKMLAKFVDSPKCLDVFRSEGLLQNLTQCNENLEVVQKGLNDYLETKRLKFPRFFFLSNDNLLEILSETKDPSRVQPHLNKCFEGVNTLDFTPDMKIVGISKVKNVVQAREAWVDAACSGSSTPRRTAARPRTASAQPNGYSSSTGPPRQEAGRLQKRWRGPRTHPIPGRGPRPHWRRGRPRARHARARAR